MASIPELSETEWQALVQRALAMPDAPPERVQRALDLWRLHGLGPRERPGLRRWAAVLQFDSWAGAAVAAGMRALPSEVRQLVFSAEGCDIDLRVAPGPHGFALSGQLLGVEGAGAWNCPAQGPASQAAAPNSMPWVNPHRRPGQ